ncbi:MAG: hypothetical protein HWN66_12305 [Candidatus Helarchaeota archaeon]|nr:hypothetical protein [Candidatus Helarchaeota archaeon]
MGKAGSIIMIVGGTVLLVFSILFLIVFQAILLPVFYADPLLGPLTNILIRRGFIFLMIAIALMVMGIVAVIVKGTTQRVMGGIGLGASGFVIIFLIISMLQSMGITIAAGDPGYIIGSLIGHIMLLGISIIGLVGGIVALASSSDY